MYFYEEHTRIYNNMVKIVYEIMDDRKVYIHSIVSTQTRKGHATNALKCFIEDFKEYEILLFSSNELGADKEFLDKWYIKLGFEEYDDTNCNYNITHILKPKISKSI